MLEPAISPTLLGIVLEVLEIVIANSSCANVLDSIVYNFIRAIRLDLQLPARTSRRIILKYMVMAKIIMSFK
jgi:hypothetical protein